MIAALRGIVTVKAEGHVVIDVGGVGYQCFMTPGAMALLPVGEVVLLHVHTVVREDALDLYAFVDGKAKSLFMQFIALDRVGPKAAMRVLAAAPADEVEDWLTAGNVAQLTAIKGVGPKMAQTLVEAWR